MRDEVETKIFMSKTMELYDIYIYIRKDLIFFFKQLDLKSWLLIFYI